MPFSASDSRSIETAFQKLAEEEDARAKRESATGDITDAASVAGSAIPSFGLKKNTNLDNSKNEAKSPFPKVAVNEDFLFDVDIDNRELAPAYWLGPIYEVRRGTWFYNDGSSSRPCDENLATQLEEGYLKTKPWQYEPPPPPRSSSQSKRPASWKPGDSVGKLGATNIKPPRLPSVDDAQNRKKEDVQETNTTPAAPKFQLQTHRLFGAHMNSVVTYQDGTVAWLVTDDFLSRMSTTVYQRFAGGGHLGGIKVVRGFVDSDTRRETRADGNANENTEVEDRGRSGRKTQQRPGSQSRERPVNIKVEQARQTESVSESKRWELEKRMATIVGSPGFEDPALQEEEVRKREETEIQEDYRDTDGEDQGREIEHLVLVTHGIGQRLGLKMESLSFIHDVNVLRKTLKSVYLSSPDLQALNTEVDKLPKNCRIQVLPIIWRHLLDFPKQSFKRQGKEQDLSDVSALGEELDYPKLSDITVDGVPAIRNLVEDLFLDILLYQSSYRYYIAGIIQRECNRVHKLFLERNPSFSGKVSLVGHSLGSAIMFDLLCRQKDMVRSAAMASNKRHSRRVSNVKPKDDETDLSLEFEVEDFYALGSPLGLFQMIEGRTIAGRRATANAEGEGSLDAYAANQTYRKVSASSISDSSLLSTVSSPKCAQVFNIFHPTDPVAYRIEPLISPAMKALKPQPLPYIKKGIFGAPVAGLSGIGVRVGQSVSGLWSNLTTGVASTLLNRSLGLTNGPQQVSTQTRQPLSMGAASNIAAGGSDSDIGGPAAENNSDEDAPVEHPPTLIDTKIETLYSEFRRQQGYGKRDRSGDRSKNPDWQEVEDKVKQYRREEAKVRALNSTGRVDFSIQE